MLRGVSAVPGADAALRLERRTSTTAAIRSKPAHAPPTPATTTTMEVCEPPPAAQAGIVTGLRRDAH